MNADRLVRWAMNAIKALIVVVLVAIVFMVFGNVVLRYFFDSGIEVSEELSRWGLVWITFLGAIVALEEGHHLGVDSFVARLSRRGRTVCYLVTRATMLAVSLMFLAGAWRQTLIDADSAAPVTGLSNAWFYGVAVVFSAASALILLRDLWRCASGRLTDAQLIGVVESEEGGS